MPYRRILLRIGRNYSDAKEDSCQADTSHQEAKPLLGSIWRLEADDAPLLMPALTTGASKGEFPDGTRGLKIQEL
jgi:hypothetical protein